MLKYPSKLFTPDRVYYNKKTNRLGNALTEVYEGNRISIDGLKWYLEMGYVPGSGTLFEGITILRNYADIKIEDDNLKLGSRLFLEDIIIPQMHDGKNKTELVKEGGMLFNEVIDTLLKESDKQIVLPLSAGMDSRMILGGLLNCTETKNITTFTWGMPNTLDYEVSKQITSKLGIKHHALNVSEYELTEDRLLRFADQSDCSVPLFDHWPVDSVKQITNQNNGAIWMGLMGGSLSGSNLPKSFAENPYAYFFKANDRIPSITSLSASLIQTRPDIQDLKALASDFNEVTYDTLDINFHHEDLIAPTKLHRDFDYILPFTDPSLINFFLALPIEHRINRSLLREMISFHYPTLGRFPTNKNDGLGLNISGKRKTLLKTYQKVMGSKINYGSSRKYISLIRYTERDLELKALVDSKLKNLDSRNLVNKEHLEKIKNEFFGNGNVKIDHSRAVDILVSLEIILELVDYK